MRSPAVARSRPRSSVDANDPDGACVVRVWLMRRSRGKLSRASCTTSLRLRVLRKSQRCSALTVVPGGDSADDVGVLMRILALWRARMLRCGEAKTCADDCSAECASFTANAHRLRALFVPFVRARHPRTRGVRSPTESCPGGPSQALGRSRLNAWRQLPVRLRPTGFRWQVRAVCAS